MNINAAFPLDDRRGEAMAAAATVAQAAAGEAELAALARFAACLAQAVKAERHARRIEAGRPLAVAGGVELQTRTEISR